MTESTKIVTLVGGFRAGLKGEGPYLARPEKDNCPDWPYWYVAGPDGRRNVLFFPDCPGVVLTLRETAEAIVEEASR